MNTTVTITPAKPPVTKTVILQPGAPEQVHLSMSRHDAEVLALILMKVGGPPEGPRGAQLRISNALRSAGVRYHGVAEGELMYVAAERLMGISGIQFKD